MCMNLTKPLAEIGRLPLLFSDKLYSSFPHPLPLSIPLAIHLRRVNSDLHAY